MLNIFSCACWPSVPLLQRNVSLGLVPIFNGIVCFSMLLSYMSCSYILEIKPLSVASFANIFTQSINFLCVLFNVSFAEQKDASFCPFAHFCPTLCNPMDCSLPGSSDHGIFQARILQWVAISFSRDLPYPGTEPRSPALQADPFIF